MRIILLITLIVLGMILVLMGVLSGEVDLAYEITSYICTDCVGI